MEEVDVDLLPFSGCRGSCRGAVEGRVGGEGRVDQGVPEGTASSDGRKGRGGEYVPGGGISLEVAEMTSVDLLDVDAGGMVGKDKGNPIAVGEGREE
eukprot:g21294.t1